MTDKTLTESPNSAPAIPPLPLRDKLMRSALQLDSYVNSLQGRAKMTFLGTFLLVVLALFGYGSWLQLKYVNWNDFWVDQDAYLNYVRNLERTDYTYVGDHNRMPLYPFLQSLHFEHAAGESAYFDAAKVFNIALSALLLVGVFVIYVLYLPPLAAMNLMLLTTFLVFVFKSAYFQAELLYYVLSFGAFLCMMEMLIKARGWLAVVTGLVVGFSHMTKGSIVPGLVLFGVIFALQAAFEVWKRKSARLKVAVSRAVMLGLVLLFYLAVIYPYISGSQRVFGRYFYNVNTTFYVWYDSWEEARLGIRTQGDYLGFPDVSEDELPSLQKYLREKSVSEIVARIFNGFYVSLQRHTVRGGYGYFWYGLALGFMGLFLLRRAFQHKRKALGEIARRHGFLLLFIGAFFVAYLTLYAFYVPIHAGQRFMLSLFLPFTFVMMMLFNQPIFRSIQAKLSGREVSSVAVFNVILFGVLSLHSLANALYGAGIIHGGG